MEHIQTQTEWEEEMGKKVLAYIRDELCMDFPFFDVALRAFEPVGKDSLRAFATEGIHLYFPAAHYLKVFEENDLFLKRAYLHVLLHCLYAHLWTKGMRDQNRWNLACDIAVEYLIDGFDRPSTRRLLSWSRTSVYDRMRQEKVISAPQIYDLLEEYSPDQRMALAQEFYTDDHGLWGEKQQQAPMPGRGNSSDQAQKKWQKLARQVQFKREKSDKTDEETYALSQARIEAGKRRRTYRDFLIRFATYHEQLRVNEDEFDLNYYTYGLREYGNLLLIEPLETREEKRIQEFVIAVDTSYSTNGELVEQFLKETLGVLLEKNAFFTTAKIHLLQCDDQIQEDLVITQATDIEAVFRRFEIKGGGNTDFRPVFSYVEELKRAGAVQSLGGLLYFTDGNGIYPQKRPDYKCAFLYMDDYEEEKVPAWAIRLKLGKEGCHEYRAGEGRD